MRVLWVVLALVVLAVAGLSGYAYLGDMAPERREMRVPISLTGAPLPEAGASASTEPAPDTDTPQPDAPGESGAAGGAPAAGADILD